MQTLKQREAIILEYYRRFHDPKFLEWDPLSVTREYLATPDVEWIALISALFAFGGVKQIIKTLRGVLPKLQQPSLYLEMTEVSDEKVLSKMWADRLKGFRHRIYIDCDLVVLLLLYRRSVQKYGSLQAHFLHFHEQNAETVEAALSGVILEYRTWADEIEFKPGRFFKHMLNSPEQKSACKRWLMYLKWMVREDDGIDLGLWANNESLRPDQLLIPLDTHLFKISKRLKLTRRKTANFLTSVEVTRNLKKIDARDPTKFDFSLCRWGMFDYRKLDL